MPSRLLLVTVDRLPAWMLSPWGATWVSTPALDRLAAAGLVLDRLVATSLDRAVTAADLIRPLAGVPGVLVTDDAALASAVGGLRDGAVTFVEPIVPRRKARTPADTNHGRLFAAAAAAVDDHRLVWIHSGSLGVAWDAPEGLLEPYVDPDDPPPPAGVAVPSLRVDRDTDPDLVVGHRQRLAAQVTLLDRLLGEFVDAIGAIPAAGTATDRAGAPSREWSVCIAGLRGMALGLHGRCGLPDTAGDEVPFGELTHLPAILVDPHGRMAGQRYPGLVIPADLGSTLRSLVDDRAADAGRAPAADAGRSLAPLLADWSHEERDRVVSVGGGGAAVVTPRWSYVEETVPGEAPRRRLHARPDDFFELCDVADRCPDETEVLAGVAALARGARPGLAWTADLGAAAG